MTEHDHTDDERTDDEEKVQVAGYVPRNVKEAAKANCEYGEFTEVIEAAIRAKAFGSEAGDRASVKQELDSVRDEIDEHKSDIRGIRANIDRLERRESRLEERLTDLADKEERYEGHLESLESQLYDGTHIAIGHGGVERAASTNPEKSQSDVIADLKRRNPEVPDRAFMTARDAPRSWDGIDSDESEDESERGGGLFSDS